MNKHRSKYKLIAEFDLDSAIIHYLRESNEGKSCQMICSELTIHMDTAVKHTKKLLAESRIRKLPIGNRNIFYVD